MEDKINPNHYKGLKDLYIEDKNTGKPVPAQVIDIIESVTRDFKGGFATSLGNVIKYLLRFNLKGHDSYQDSQFEKNCEELKKVAWYSARFKQLVDYSDSSCRTPSLCEFLLSKVYNSKNSDKRYCTLFDVYGACQGQYPASCREMLLQVFIDIDKIVSNCQIGYWSFKLEEDTAALVTAYQYSQPEIPEDKVIEKSK